MAMPMPRSITTFHQAFDAQAALTPDALGTISCGRSRHSLSYAAIGERSQHLACCLAQQVLMHHDQGEIEEYGPMIAVHLPRTHDDFVPLLIAASRCGLPFVLLSTDLPNKSLESERNVMAVRTLSPVLCIIDKPSVSTYFDVVCVDIKSLASSRASSGIVYFSRRPEFLCAMFTGGTNRTKVVEVTHAMVLHERIAYRELWRPRKPPRVLAHTSVYWGASALGQLSISLAYGGAAVWTEATEVEELQRCINDCDVTVLGLVPDHLDLLAPSSPERELSRVEVVFTWGERLPRHVADRWRKHPLAILRELLIATEYWLSLWADPLGDGTLHVVSGTELLVLKQDGGDAAIGELGELCIAGPMVMAGYRKLSDASPMSDIFCTDHTGKSFFRTRDLVRRAAHGVIYKGRADMMTKEKGQWVDMLAIEDDVSRIVGVCAVRIVPDPAQEHFHVMIVLDRDADVDQTLGNVQAGLPSKAHVWLLSELPRHPVTRKVDINRLLQMIPGRLSSWPIEGDLRSPPNYLQERLLTKLCYTSAWTIAALGVVWAVADKMYLGTQFTLAATTAAGVCMLTALRQERQAIHAIFSLLAASLWLITSIFIVPLDAARSANGARSLMFFTYGWLVLIYADDSRPHFAFARYVMCFIDELPFWKIGIFIAVSLGQHASGWWGIINHAVAVSTTVLGVFIAGRRRRLISWPVVFWAAGGHQIGTNCGKWVHLSYWWKSACWVLSRAASVFVWARRIVLSIGSDLAKSVRTGSLQCQTQPSETPIAATAPCQAPNCGTCGVNLGATRWPAKDDMGALLCDACGAAFVERVEADALSWLGDQLRPTMVNLLHGTDVQDENSNELDRRPRLEPKPKRSRLSKSCEEDGATPCKTEHSGKLVQPLGPSPMAICQGRTRHADDLRSIEAWWWFNRKTESVKVNQEEGLRLTAHGCKQSATYGIGVVADLPLSPEAKILCSIIEEIEPLLKPVLPDTLLLGLDSLRVARLASTIRIRFGRDVTAAEVRASKTTIELVATVARAKQLPTSDDAGDLIGSHIEDSIGREFKVWYSPGQYASMGNWVLRIDEPLDEVSLAKATRDLVDRHPALRVMLADPLRYNSFVFDAATMFSLFGPILNAGPRVARCFRQLLSWAFASAWPRLRVCSRTKMYSGRFPEVVAPFDVIRCTDGQDSFEYALKKRRFDLVPPFALTGYELVCHLADVWAYERWRHRFEIIRVPDELQLSFNQGETAFYYVDIAFGEYGRLVGPSNTEWKVPPYGFPALFVANLNSGAVVWFRLERNDELRVVYKQNPSAEFTHHFVAYRMAPQRARDTHAPQIVSHIGVCVMHSWADGGSYLPIVQDLMLLYQAARGESATRLPAVGNAFEELERRLMDQFYMRPSPVRSSLRGSLFKYDGKGYNHEFGLESNIIHVLKRSCLRYRVPLDVALFGLLTCAVARADESDSVDFTLYAPMRDGPEATGVGLFADWRDLIISVDFQLATILGTLLHCGQRIHHRQWTAFNALRKPERMIVNIQPLDFQHRAGFVHLGENMWRDGDQLGNKPERRGSGFQQMNAHANFVIEQQDEDTWWILCSADSKRPPRWMRRCVYAFQEAVESFITDPLRVVHRPLPSDDDLLWMYEKDAIADGFLQE